MSKNPRLRTDALGERYAIERTLGRGGMATVYLARDRALERPVALKVLAAELADDQAFRRRFLREARLAAKLVHPHIVQVYDVGENEHGPFIVTEYVEGDTLAEELRRRGRLTPKETVEVGIQLCSALEAAHAAGLVHRDIKPQNILRRPDGQLKLADFGIARSLAASRQTEIGTVLGTAAYVAPEQARGEPVTAAADIYALGVVLYELLTGQTPFHADTLPELVLKRVQTTPTPPSTLAPGLPAALDAIVMSCLAPRPEQRPASAATLARQLAAAIDTTATEPLPNPITRPTRVLPPTAATSPLRPARPQRLRRLPAAAALLVLLTLAGLLAAALLNTGRGHHTPNAAAQTPTPTASDTTAASTTSATTGVTSTPPANTATSTTPPPAATSPEQAVASALAAISQAEASGQLDPKAANDLNHQLNDLAKALLHPNPNAAAHKTADLLRHLNDLGQAGQLTSTGLTEIAAPLQQLAALLPATAGPPGQSDNRPNQGENDNG